jgi:hypothetical protein
MRRLTLLAFACTACAYAALVQNTGENQGAHYALVKSLTRGTPYIDETRREVGDLGTSDVAYIDGHVYAAKPPGLAMASVPPYLVAKSLGVPSTGDPGKMLWVLTVWGVVVPAVTLLALLAWVAGRLQPGTETATAIVAGLGTLILPYATLFYAHVLSAALGFGAFALLVKARTSPRPLVLLFLAGVAAGLAVTVEQPVGLLAAALGVYAAWGAGWAPRAATYVAGCAIGALPLVAYNVWAFGGPFRTPYTATPQGPGDGLLGLGFYRPTLDAVLQILVGPIGLLRVGPVLACGLVGLWLLWRWGHRAEAALGSAVFGAFLIYDASWFAPLGGASAGPRFVIPAIPFAALGLTAAWRAFASPTRVLAAVSVVVYSVIAATHPLAASSGGVLERLRDGGFSSTVVQYLAPTGSWTIVVFFFAVGAAFVTALAASRVLAVELEGRAVAVTAIGAWAVVGLVSPGLLEERALGAELLLVLLTALAVAAVVLVARRESRRPLARHRLGARAGG